MSGCPVLGCGPRSATTLRAIRHPGDAGRPTAGCGAGGSLHCKKRTGGTFQMNAQKLGRLALITATTGFMVGVALLNSGSSNAIGGLCNGRPASHTWLDASGQYG